MGSRGWKRQLRKQRAIIRHYVPYRELRWRQAQAEIQAIAAEWIREVWNETARQRPFWRQLVEHKQRNT